MLTVSSTHCISHSLHVAESVHLGTFLLHVCLLHICLLHAITRKPGLLQTPWRTPAYAARHDVKQHWERRC